MRRGRFLTLLLGGVVSIALAGCTSFTPVYGDRGGASAETLRFNFAAPSNRMEQIILSRLGLAFPAVAGPNDPVLSVRANNQGLPGTMSDAFSTRSPNAIRVEATVTIKRGDEVLFEAKRFTDTSYQSVGQNLAGNAAAVGAEETAARSTAESLRAAILAGYRPAQ